MTKKQIEILKRLGYEDTQEDGALLQHRGLDNNYYLWKGEKFNDVLEEFYDDVVRSAQSGLVHELRKLIK